MIEEVLYSIVNYSIIDRLFISQKFLVLVHYCLYMKVILYVNL